MRKVYGKVVNRVICLVYIYEGVHYAIAIDGSGLIAAW